MRSDEEAAFVEYLSARLPRLHRTAYLLCGDAHRADDVVQLTAMAMYKNWAMVREADNIDAYVHRMLVRQFLRTQRGLWSKVLLTSRVPDRPVSDEVRIENREVILSALDRLPKGMRTVLVLRYFSDLSVEDTAIAMNISIGTVKSQTHRGLAHLREMLSDSLRSMR
jgi:RNA polymerase sigma-70 factor (sigma-E family)